MEWNETSERRYDIDWLRVLALGLLLIYHAAVVFHNGTWVQIFFYTKRGIMGHILDSYANAKCLANSAAFFDFRYRCRVCNQQTQLETIAT